MPQVPDGLLEVDLSDGAAVVTLDTSLYPLEAIYGATYVLIDRAYVLLDRPAPERIRATVMAKTAETTAAELHALVGELANELLACAYRQQLTAQNRVLVETVTMQAMAGAMGAPSLDDLADFDFTDDALDDPLGIAQSWEERHGKKPLESAAADADEPAEGGPDDDTAGVGA